MSIQAPPGPPTTAPRLLAGPPPSHGPEDLDAHTARLGPRPPGSRNFLDVLEASGIVGRGGAAFPAARKWRAVAVRSGGDAVVVANGLEGEPASAKDRVLCALRPHLVLDGLAVAAETVGATRAVIVVPRAFPDAHAALARAIAERSAAAVDGIRPELRAGPHRYVAGQETAVVSLVEGGAARPRTTPPRPFSRGVHGRPTLVQNVETLADAALLARFGEAWFRGVGTAGSPGTVLLTVTGAVARPGVLEVALGTTVGTAVAAAGGTTAPPMAVLLGGYFGRVLAAETAWTLPLDDASLAAVGAGLGAGVLLVLPQGVCGLAEASRVLAFLAEESAGQCGPCVHGLAAISGAMSDLATGRARPADVDRLRRWAGEVRDRGACRHPDGAALFAEGVLETFAADVRAHLRGRPCRAASAPPLFPVPAHDRAWR